MQVTRKEAGYLQHPMYRYYSSFCVGLLLFISLVSSPVEGGASGWRPIVETPPPLFAPNVTFEYNTYGNGSDLFVVVQGGWSPSVPSNISICETSDCKPGQILHTFEFPASNSTITYPLLNAVPGWQNAWLVVPDHPSFMFQYAAVGAFNYSLNLAKPMMSFSFRTVPFFCNFTQVGGPEFVVRVQAKTPEGGAAWTCTVPLFDAASLAEGTTFLMTVQQSVGDSTRVIPSLSGQVTYKTGAVVGSYTYTGCIGSNTTFVGQFSMSSTYLCSYDPVSTGGIFIPPESSTLVACPVPTTSSDTPITALSLWESSGSVTRVIFQTKTGLPDIRTCVGGGDGDDDVPYWAWIVVGCGAGAILIFVVVMAAVAVFIMRKRRQHYYERILN